MPACCLRQAGTHTHIRATQPPSSPLPACAAPPATTRHCRTAQTGRQALTVPCTAPHQQRSSLQRQQQATHTYRPGSSPSGSLGVAPAATCRCWTGGCCETSGPWATAVTSMLVAARRRRTWGPSREAADAAPEQAAARMAQAQPSGRAWRGSQAAPDALAHRSSPGSSEGAHHLTRLLVLRSPKQKETLSDRHWRACPTSLNCLLRAEAPALPSACWAGWKARGSGTVVRKPAPGVGRQPQVPAAASTPPPARAHPASAASHAGLHRLCQAAQAHRRCCPQTRYPAATSSMRWVRAAVPLLGCSCMCGCAVLGLTSLAAPCLAPQVHPPWLLSVG